jgi:hypothetical protein
MKTYSEKLRDPKWQKKRLEVLQRDEFCCQLCNDKETELHIHHIFYRKGKNPWEYNDNELVTYCKYCHLIVEKYKDFVVFQVNNINNYYLVHLCEYDINMDLIPFLFILQLDKKVNFNELARLNFNEIGNNFFNIIKLIK